MSAAESRPRFEYWVEPIGQAGDAYKVFQAWLNAAGADGWEVVSVDRDWVVMKRPRLR